MVPVPKDPPDRDRVRLVHVSMSRDNVSARVKLDDGTWQTVTADYAISCIGPLPPPKNTAHA